MSRRTWTSDEDAFVRRTLLTHSVNAQARALGRTKWSVIQRRDELRRSDRLPVNQRHGNRPWTPEDDERLVDKLESGLSIAQIAGALHRTAHAVRDRAIKVHGGIKRLRSGLLGVRTRNQVAHLFGVHPNSVERWVQHGWLVGKRNRSVSAAARTATGRKSSTHYLIPDLTIEAFLHIREAWPFWTIENMTDPDWRAAARDIRPDADWIPLVDFARERHYSDSTATGWVYRGELPATKIGGKWYIWHTDAAAFVPPLERTV